MRPLRSASDPSARITAQRGCRGTARPPVNQHRGGAEEARGAHNPEDTGSKPVSGIIIIITLRSFKEATKHNSIQYPSSPIYSSAGRAP